MLTVTTIKIKSSVISEPSLLDASRITRKLGNTLRGYITEHQ